MTLNSLDMASAALRLVAPGRRAEHVGALAVLREVESRELVILVHADPTRDGACDGETDQRPDDRDGVGEQHRHDL